jgi:hypothetical protein
MFIKLLIISVVFVAIIMLALGIKLLFNKDAKFTYHSCQWNTKDDDQIGACPKCGLEDLSDCPETGENK